MVPEFEAAAFSTPVGQISPMFKTVHGWHMYVTVYFSSFHLFTYSLLSLFIFFIYYSVILSCGKLSLCFDSVLVEVCFLFKYHSYNLFIFTNHIYIFYYYHYYYREENKNATGLCFYSKISFHLYIDKLIILVKSKYT